MTSGAKKEKARKKAKAQKLLDEEQQRGEEEKARQAPVSTPIPLPAVTAPVPESFPPVNDDLHPHAWYPDPHRPMFDASTLIFDDDEPGPVPSAAQIHAFIYGPVLRSPSPTPARYISHNDVVNNPPVHAIHSICAPPSALPPRDFSALCNDNSANPWRTIRRRNHRQRHRLVPERRPFPQSLPKRPTLSSPRHSEQPPAIHLISDPFIPPFDADEPIPVLVLPRPIPLPLDPYQFIPSQCPTLEHSLPGETVYGPVQSGLALVCAREYPWIHVALANISEIAWGAHPPDELDEREDVLGVLLPDQLVFLMVLVEICRLELDFTGFVEPAIADFVNAWLDHCWSVG
ncbi:hypothetical protein DFH09DRAFT_1093837 [Mycena vulgaris]|nr:hypothetical protein DFH09DRAFT_1093837 [Mycena vulgaris]